MVASCSCGRHRSRSHLPPGDAEKGRGLRGWIQHQSKGLVESVVGKAPERLPRGKIAAGFQRERNASRRVPHQAKRTRIGGQEPFDVQFGRAEVRIEDSQPEITVREEESIANGFYVVDPTGPTADGG